MLSISVSNNNNNNNNNNKQIIRKQRNKMTDANIILVKPSIELLTTDLEMGLMSKRIEEAGRTCYKSEDKITGTSSEKFIKKILKSGHESVIEHCGITIRFICSRTTSHQLVRHRLGSYSQESQRYCNYGKNVDALQVIPPTPLIEWAEDRYDETFDMMNDPSLPAHAFVFLSSAVCDYDKYLRLVNTYDWKPEEARDVLPGCTKTEVVTTYNLRQWRWFFEKRCDKHAQKPIRDLAKTALATLYTHLPAIFEDQYNKFIVECED